MNKFSLFYKSGGGCTILVVDKYWQQLNTIFDKMSENSYSTDILQFHLALRVDGEFFQFGDTQGCNSLKLFKKKRLIANSISFGEHIYKHEPVLAQFLYTNVILAFEQIIKRLEKEKLNIDGQRLIDDLTTGLKKMVATN